MRTHTRRPRAGISAASVARSYRDNCPCFSVSSLSPRVARVLLLFGCHAAVHDSPPPPPPATPRTGAICQVARPFHHVDQEHLEVFQPTSCLDVFSPRSSSENHFRVSMRESSQFRNCQTRSSPRSEINFEINCSWKIVTSCRP